MELEHRLPTVEEYRKLRSLAGWCDTDEEAARSGLSNSLFSVVATEGDTVIGFGRVVGDGGLYFYIQDLIVHPDFRSKGVGKAIMNRLMAYIGGIAKPGSFIALMAAKGLRRYYEAFGFEVRDEDAPGMYRVLK